MPNFEELTSISMEVNVKSEEFPEVLGAQLQKRFTNPIRNSKFS